MKLTDIANIRLNSQQITVTNFKTAKDLVGWMGAMQAQDYTMSKWAIGTRLPDSTDHEIQNAIDNGDIIRTHILRPTWHLVSAKDISWMLELSAPQIKSSMKSRDKELELNENIFIKCNLILEKALTGGKHLTREELRSILQNAEIATSDNRFSHILAHAELDRIICSGTAKSNKLTYSLFSERVPIVKKLTRDEALANLAQKYFSSHGPATLQDFAWWSGLSVLDSKKALEMVKSEFISETINLDTYWFSNSISLPGKYEPSIYFLPAYDEFLISYKNRSASILKENQKKTISSNGFFRPVIVINGQVAGLWKRAIKNDKVIIETDFFHPINKMTKNLIENKIERYGHFIDKKLEISKL